MATGMGYSNTQRMVLCHCFVHACPLVVHRMDNPEFDIMDVVVQSYFAVSRKAVEKLKEKIRKIEPETQSNPQKIL